jgi:hypothetical protein
MEPNFCDRGYREALEAALVRPDPLPTQPPLTFAGTTGN